MKSTYYVVSEIPDFPVLLKLTHNNMLPYGDNILWIICRFITPQGIYELCGVVFKLRGLKGTFNNFLSGVSNLFHMLELCYGSISKEGINILTNYQWLLSLKDISNSNVPQNIICIECLYIYNQIISITLYQFLGVRIGYWYSHIVILLTTCPFPHIPQDTFLIIFFMIHIKIQSSTE